MSTSKIEWLMGSDGSPGMTWNPITGCTKISDGCKNCYAQRMAKRLAGRYGYPKDNPFEPGVCHNDKLEDPFRWKKPQRIFVCSMGDLFHEKVNIMSGARVLSVAEEAHQHTYLFLTKRPDIMETVMKFYFGKRPMPKNWWLGVTVCNQQEADEKIPILLQIPAAVRFISVEPMLSPVDIDDYIRHYNYETGKIEGKNGRLFLPQNDSPETKEPKGPIHQIIVGGESGPGARPMHPDWARSLRDQCVSAGVPFFFKQWGSNPHPDAFESIPMVNAVMQAKKGGRLLDGQIWDQTPTAPPASKRPSPQPSQPSPIDTGGDRVHHGNGVAGFK